MSYFKRWYVQPPIVKIDSELANTIYDERIAAAFPLGHQFGGIEFIQLESTTEDGQQPTFKQLTDDADDIFPDMVGEIYHCNVKFPISQIERLWDVDVITSRSYLDAVALADINFGSFLRSKIMEDFVDFEEFKIPKVGQYLRNDPGVVLYYPRTGVKVPISKNEGLALFTAIERTSDIFLSGRYHIDTGNAEAGSLISFQAIIFIPKKITEEETIQMSGNIYAATDNEEGAVNLSGETFLGLNRLRDLACVPKPKIERAPKQDDPTAHTTKKKLTPSEINARKLTKQEKVDISKKVKAKLLQVSDSSFINALLNADKIKTTRDVMDFVLNVLPLQQIINIAIECLKKYLPDPPDVVVCNIIMRKLSNRDVKRLLQYANVNLTTDTVAAAFKSELIDKFDGSIEDDPAGFKSFLLTQFNTNVGTKEIICAMVFLAIPAAITLLAIYTKQEFGSLVGESGVCADSLTPPEIKTKELLENPAKTALNAIEEGLKNHPILSFTKDLPDNLLRQLISFVNKIIVESISLMLQELAYMCDGTSKSDFANSPTQASPFNSDINDLLINKNDDAVYDDLFDFVFDENPGAAVDKQLIKDFFEGLAELLSLSELCILMSGDPNDFRYNLVVDKIFYGLLALDGYAPIKQVLNTRQKLINFINVFAEKFDQVACNDRIEELTKNKKLLSELCSSTDDAYINDLKNKAAQSAIDDMLNQEKDLLNDLLDAIKDLTSPEIPEAFCGPAATESGAEVLLPSFQDKSQVYLAKKNLSTILRLANRTFQTELDNFRLLFSRLPGDQLISPRMVSTVSKIMSTGLDVSRAMAKTYEIDPKDENGNSFFSVDDIKTDLGDFTALQGQIAPKVNLVLTGLSKGTNLDISVAESDEFGGLVLRIATFWDDKQLRYFAHYIAPAGVKPDDFEETDYIIPGFEDDDDDGILPAGHTKLIYSQLPAQQSPNNLAPIGTPIAIYNGLVPDGSSALPLKNIGIFQSYGANREIQSPFKDIIKEFIEEKPEFFGEILERIIVEHAEFISVNDFFRKQVFDRLNLSTTNACDPSLLYFSDITGKMQSRTEGIECKVGIGNIPTPTEIVHIASLYEATLRVVTLTELMKMMFVFVSFGIETLLPEISNTIPITHSFYYNYLVEKVDERMKEIIPDQFKSDMDRAVDMIAAHDLGIDEKDLDGPQRLQLFVFDSIKVLSTGLLNRIKTAGFKTKINDSSQTTPQLIGNSDDDEITGEFLKSIYTAPSSTILYEQIIRNLIPAEKELAILSSPDVIEVDFAKKETFIPAGFYSSNPRLQNGGFFIEEGIEVLSHRVFDETQIGRFALKPKDLLSLIAMLPHEGTTHQASLGENVAAILLHKPSLLLEAGPSAEFVPEDTMFLDDIHYQFRLMKAKNVVNLLGIAKAYDEQNKNIMLDHKFSGLNLFKNGIPYPDILPFAYGGQDLGSALSQAFMQTNYLYLIQKHLFAAEQIGTDEKIISSLYNGVCPGQYFTDDRTDSVLQSEKSSQLAIFSRKQGRLGYQSEEVKTELGTVFEAMSQFAYFICGAAQALEYSYYGGASGIESTKLIQQQTIIDTLKEILDVSNFTVPEEAESKSSLKPGENPFYDTELEAELYWAEKGYKLEEIDSILAGNFIPEGYEQYVSEDIDRVPDLDIDGSKDFEYLKDLLKQRLEKINTYFYKFGAYKTFNLLIRLNDAGGAAIDTTILGALNELVEDLSLEVKPFPGPQGIKNETTKNAQSFTRAVLERKYFLREKETGILYFKLPLIYKFDSISNASMYTKNILDAQQSNNIFDITEEEIAIALQSLFQSIPYQDLLSFMSILVNQIVEIEYPSVNDIFKNTIRTLGTGTQQALAASNRVNNPDLYANEMDASFYNSPSMSNPNLISAFIEAIFKGVANTTDPTWRTPWFLPGPLTPFGIIAKLLEGADDESATDTPEKSANKNKEETDTSQAYECNDGSQAIEE